MRRPIAISLMLLCLFVSALPFWAAAAQASVPACCRRGGLHRCGMLAGGGDNEQSLRNNRELCPYRSGVASVARRVKMFVMSEAAPRDVDIAHSNIIVSLIPALKPLYISSCYERGPPSPSR